MPSTEPSGGRSNQQEGAWPAWVNPIAKGRALSTRQGKCFLEVNMPSLVKEPQL